ncbi:MAG: VOC family protein [Bacteroidota bacterium]
MFKPKGLNHITIRVNRIQDSKYFYETLLGLELVKTMGQSMAVYDLGNGDTLVIVEAETSYDPSSRDFRVDQFGFYLDEPKEFDELAEYLRKH